MSSERHARWMKNHTDSDGLPPFHQDTPFIWHPSSSIVSWSRVSAQAIPRIEKTRPLKQPKPNSEVRRSEEEQTRAMRKLEHRWSCVKAMRDSEKPIVFLG
jgi:hypothetical protein